MLARATVEIVVQVVKGGYEMSISHVSTEPADVSDAQFNATADALEKYLGTLEESNGELPHNVPSVDFSDSIAEHVMAWGYQFLGFKNTIAS